MNPNQPIHASFLDDYDRLKAENTRLAQEATHWKTVADYFRTADPRTCDVIKACRKIVQATPVPPNAITWEKGVELLNLLQNEVCPAIRLLL